MTKLDLNGLIISTFINNIKVMASKKSGIIKYVKAAIAVVFSMIHMSPISFNLGLKLEQNRGKRIIKLLHPVYINKVLSKFHFD